MAQVICDGINCQNVAVKNCYSCNNSICLLHAVDIGKNNLVCLDCNYARSKRYLHREKNYCCYECSYKYSKAIFIILGIIFAVAVAGLVLGAIFLNNSSGNGCSQPCTNEYSTPTNCGNNPITPPDCPTLNNIPDPCCACCQNLYNTGIGVMIPGAALTVAMTVGFLIQLCAWRSLRTTENHNKQIDEQNAKVMMDIAIYFATKRRMNGRNGVADQTFLEANQTLKQMGISITTN